MVFLEKALPRDEKTQEKNIEKAWRYHKMEEIEVVEMKKKKVVEGEDLRLERIYITFTI